MPEEIKPNGEKKAKSRRYTIIKIFIFLILFCIAYVSFMIPFMGEKFSPFVTFFLTTAGALIAVVGTWIGFISAKKKDG